MSPRFGYRLPPGLAPRPAPGHLRLIQDFVNTRDVGTDRDDLGTPQDLEAWLSRHQLVTEDDRILDTDWTSALAFRDGLRALIRSHNRGQRLDPKTIEDLNAVAAQVEVPHRFRFEHDDTVRRVAAASGWSGALLRLLESVDDAVREGSWKRLKECPCETCLRIFYDSSSNRSGRWCNPRRCGNRINTKRYRKRGPKYSRYRRKHDG